jgi:biotin-dependent carboxylase-like uncharacterized protein
MIKVIASGLHSSLQDLGRFGHRNCGVPVSGAMDLRSASNANAMIGNDPNATVLEFMASGPVLEFHEAAVIGISGAIFSPKIDGNEVGMNTSIQVKEGSTLSFGSPSKGLRAYLAIKGGFTPEIMLSSSSYYLGVTKEGQLKKNDILHFDQSDKRSSKTNRSKAKTDLQFDSNEIEVFKGPEFELLPESIQNKLKSTSFTIDTRSNRMAYWLEHSEDISAKDIITAPVQPGTVQITPVGKVIVLMRDAQTTGGYARIFQLSKNAIDLLAQKRSGEIVSFKMTDPLFQTHN